MNWKLQLTLHSPHKKVVNHNIIRWLVKFVSDPSQFKLSSHDLVVVKKIQSFKNVDESALSALKFWSQKVVYSEDQEIDVLGAFVSQNILACFEQVMDQKIGVAQHLRSEE